MVVGKEKASNAFYRKILSKTYTCFCTSFKYSDINTANISTEMFQRYLDTRGKEMFYSSLIPKHLMQNMESDREMYMNVGVSFYLFFVLKISVTCFSHVGIKNS